MCQVQHPLICKLRKEEKLTGWSCFVAWGVFGFFYSTTIFSFFPLEITLFSKVRCCSQYISHPCQIQHMIRKDTRTALALGGTKGSCKLYIKVLEFILLQMGVMSPEVFSGTG